MRYYINKTVDNNGRNEVHRSDCYWLHLATNTEFLGEFCNGVQAVAAAKRKGYYYADGCKHCASEAHEA